MLISILLLVILRHIFVYTRTSTMCVSGGDGTSGVEGVSGGEGVSGVDWCEWW